MNNHIELSWEKQFSKEVDLYSLFKKKLRVSEILRDAHDWRRSYPSWDDHERTILTLEKEYHEAKTAYYSQLENE